MQSVSTHVFLFFAQVVWPLLVPVAICKLYDDKRHKVLQKILIAIGMLVSLYLAWCLFSFNVSASIQGRHILYQMDYPLAATGYGSIFYILATIAPPFFSGQKKMWMLGTANLISFIVTRIFFESNVVSVWCYFAAIISALVLLIMHEIKYPSHTMVRSV